MSDLPESLAPSAATIPPPLALKRRMNGRDVHEKHRLRPGLLRRVVALDELRVGSPAPTTPMTCRSAWMASSERRSMAEPVVQTAGHGRHRHHRREIEQQLRAAWRLDDEEVDRCNDAVQVYSKDAIFFRSQQPELHEAFRQARISAAHPANPMDQLFHRLLPERLRSTTGMTRSQRAASFECKSGRIGGGGAPLFRAA